MTITNEVKLFDHIPFFKSYKNHRHLNVMNPALIIISIGFLYGRQFQNYRGAKTASSQTRKPKIQEAPIIIGWGYEDGHVITPQTNPSPDSRNHDLQTLTNYMFGSCSNPLLNTFYCCLKAVTPVIGCLTIPDIQPILTAISNAFTSIYNQISDLITAALCQIQILINSYLASVEPQIATIVADGNTAIKDFINDQFNTITSGVTSCVADITGDEIDQTNTNVNAEMSALLLQIFNCLTDAEVAVGKAISTSTSGVITDISNALSAANCELFTTLTQLISDPNNCSPVCPQLVFPDPNVIASIFTSESADLSSEIQQILNNALKCVEDATNAASACTIATETLILDTANQKIICCINELVNAALAAICEFIKSITLSEIADITALITSASEQLAADIQVVLDNISTASETIVSSETTALLALLESLITANNQDVIEQVDNILATC